MKDNETEKQQYTFTDNGGYYNVKAVTLSNKKLVITKGKSCELTSSCTSTNASYKSISWTSKNNAIAKVNANGIVTGVKTGKTEVYCTYISKDGTKRIATCSVTVM